MTDTAVSTETAPRVLRAEITLDPLAQAAATQGAALIQIANDWVVDCAEVAEIVTNDVRQLEAEAKAWDEQRLKSVRPAMEIVKENNDFFGRIIKPREEAARIMREKLLGWRRLEQERVTEQKRLADEAARKARQEAEEKAAAERARAAEIAEAEAEAARQKALDEGKAKDAARFAAQAAQAAQRAENAVADGAAKAELAHLQAAAVAVPAPTAAAMPQGVGGRAKWDARVADEPDAFERLVIDVATNHRNLIGALLTFNKSGARQLAGGMKDALKVDGLVVEDVGALTIRKGK